MELKNKNVLVCGMARSGVAAANLLKYLGANVVLQDIKEESKLAEAISQLNDGITPYLGKNPDEIIENQDLIVISPGIPLDLPFIELAVKRHIPIWGEVELAYLLCPCDIIGITGTNGKTTTTAIIGEIMSSYIPHCEVVGNIGIPFTEKVIKLSNDGYVVAEMSSFQLETIHEFKPRVAVILNITPDHLNRHKTLENYTIIKERIFENQDENDYTILNYDDEVCRKMSKKTLANVVFFSRKEKLEQGVFLDGNKIRVKLFGKDINIIDINELQIFGGHNVENVLAAVAATFCVGAKENIINNALKRFKGVEHRLEYVCNIKGISFYNDSKATNVDSAIKSIEAINKPIILIGGGSYKASEYGEWVKLFKDKVKFFVAIGEVREQIIETCRAYNFMEYDLANSLKDAVELAFSKAEKEDVVLLSPACASYDMFDDYEQRGKFFKEFVLALDKDLDERGDNLDK